MKKAVHAKSRFTAFWKGKGIYVALAGVLLALGAVGVATVEKSLTQQDPLPQTKPVEQPITNQPDDRTTTTPTTSATTAATTTTTTQAEAPDLYILPLSNTVQKPYSPNALLYSATMEDWRTHSGTDFAGEEGQAVQALANGTIKTVEESHLWGWVITIDHGVGVYSRYCGVKPSVSVGQTVKVGEDIGHLSGIPCESAQSPHLHLEMTVDGDPVDPVTALAKEVRYADSTASPDSTTP